MAEIRSMYKRLILVAVLFACHAILSAEGRQIESINKKEITANKQGSINSINSKKEIFPPPIMNFGDSKASYKDHFQPTGPGNSPCVGHPFAPGHLPVVADNSKKAEHFITGDRNAFRPTAPGHCPGIGHALRNKNAEPNA